MKCVVGATAASVVSVEIVCGVLPRDPSYISWISQFSRMCQEYVWYLFQGLPQSEAMLEGDMRQQNVSTACKLEHLKKTSNRHVTFRTMNPGQEFDTGIKYVWSSRNSNKNVSLLWSFFSQLGIWFWAFCASCAWSLNSQAVFFRLCHHYQGLTSSRWCPSNIAAFPALFWLEWLNKPFPLLNRFQISQRFLSDGYCPS